MLIYCATNKYTGKKYIGQTVKPLNQRISEHKHRAYKENHHNKFYNAIKKYGWDAFEWTVLEENPAWTNEELDKKEQYYITYYDTVNNGYNILHGGQDYTEQDRLNRAIAAGSKPFYAFDIKGQLLGEFINHREFAYQHNIDPSRITDMLNNKVISAKNIIVIDKENYTPQLLQKKLKACLARKDFYVIRLSDGMNLGIWHNIETCRRELNLPRYCHITEVLKGKRKQSHGYYFEYAE